MVRILKVVGGVMCMATSVSAGGVERSTQSMDILFQDGRYIELGAQFARPRISGDAPGPTGNIAPNIFQGSFGYKADLTDRLSYAIIADQPIGARVKYPVRPGVLLSGSTAKIDSFALTGVLRYDLGNGVSVHGGLRSVWTKGEVFLPFAADYDMQTKRDQAWGYLVGAAYEMPEIAARVAVTYNSKVEHEFDHTVNGADVGTFDMTIPESVQLEFQTGIAEDTLLMGSVRWVRWTEFNISPVGQPDLVSFSKNSVTYNLGVGRRFTPNWAGSVMLGYDTGNGRTTGNLQPVSTRRSLGLGASYTQDNVTISAGVTYARLGGARTRVVNGDFSGNSLIGGGIRIGYNF